MIIKNGTILNDEFKFIKKDIGIKNGKITFLIEELENDEIIDADGKYVIPGLIDLHIHGCDGADASNGTIEDIEKMSKYLGKIGVTSFCPTTMTLPIENLEKSFIAVNEYKKIQKGGSKVQGVNMEGPYFSMEKKGAQNPDYIKNPDLEEFLRINKNAENIVKFVDIAPELEGSIDFIKNISMVTKASIAHTNATYDVAKAAIKAGALHVTHLYNAMPSFSHRAPGVIGAVYESDNVKAELICDGVHVHPAVIRSTYKILSEDRVIMISDGLSSTGMPEGEYLLGGQTVIVKNNLARLKDGTIAGSACNLFIDLQRTIGFGIKPEHAIKTATANPAKELGVYNQIGSLTENKFADILICDMDFNLEKVFINGNEISKK